MKIALQMIVAGNEDPKDLARCLKSVEGQVDGMFVCITSPMKGKELQKVAEDMGAVVEYEPEKFFHKITEKDIDVVKGIGLDPHIKVGDKIFRFDKARNYSMDMVTPDFDWIIWLDTDDILRGDKLREVIADAEVKNYQSIFLNYIYQAEIVDGKVKNVLIEHLRERLFKNVGLYHWVAPIHETLIEKTPTRKIDRYEIDVLHLSSHERRTNAINRNIKNLEYSIADTKAKDPRPIYYLGKSFFDMWTVEKDEKYLQQSLKLFETYLSGENKSGWSEERAQCWEYMAEIYRAKEEFDNAIKCCHNAMIEDERFPSVYINMALNYVMKKEWNRALFWVRIAKNIKQPDSTLVKNPRDIVARTLEIIYHSSLQTSKLDEAWAASQKLLEIFPDSQEMKNRYLMTEKMRHDREVTKLVVGLEKHLEQTGQKDKLKPLAQAIPAAIKDNPFMVELKKKVDPPRTWEKDEVAIYCGPAFTTWSPGIMENPGESFIGGSEEAVIKLAKELVKKGWKVTVYNDPGDDEGDWDGVNYQPYYKFSQADTFNIVVAWRRPDFVDQNVNAKQIYVWCHDIQNQLDYTPERLSKITKIMVLSPWHRTNLPDIPESKILITGNGI